MITLREVLLAMAVHIMRQHVYCGGDQYPENGNPEVIRWLAMYQRAKRQGMLS